jgi:hypothetical protein
MLLNHNINLIKKYIYLHINLIKSRFKIQYMLFKTELIDNLNLLLE